MSARTCRVTITDKEEVAHTVKVTATTLYEAVALGLAAIRGNEWVTGIPEGLKVARVRVTDIPVEHEVKLGVFLKWLERKSGSSRETFDRIESGRFWELPDQPSFHTFSISGGRKVLVETIT